MRDFNIQVQARWGGGVNQGDGIYQIRQELGLKSQAGVGIPNDGAGRFVTDTDALCLGGLIAVEQGHAHQ